MTQAEAAAQVAPPTRASARRGRSAAGVLLGTRLDHRARTGLQQQLYDLLRDMILSGRLGPGERLPSTRTIAEELGVSRNTATAAFEQLQAEGYVSGQVGSGTRVSEQLPEALLQSIRRPSAQVEGRSLPDISQRGREVEAAFATGAGWLPTFSPGMPAVDEFPFDAWSRMLAGEWRDPGMGAMGGDAGGYWPLRECVAEYVGAARSICCDADQVIIVSGNREGTELATRVLLDSGDRAIVEDPGYPGTKATLKASGIQAVPLRVDESGLVLSAAGPEHRAARMLLTAPSHQYPLGSTTSLPRRMELVAWAHRHGCWIVEDDYDSEFRYSGRPFPSLYSLDPDGMVIYTGTFSKTAFPSLRLGYLVVPKRLAAAFLKMKLATSGPVTLVTQRAMARFIETGLFYRHVRRMRSLYGRRRAALQAAIGEFLPEFFLPAQENAGLFLTALFGPAVGQHVRDADLASGLRQRGIHIEPLSPLYLSPNGQHGAIFGYGGLPEGAAIRPLRTVARVLHTMLR